MALSTRGPADPGGGTQGPRRGEWFRVGEEDVCSSGNWSWRRFEVNTGHVGHWDVDLTSFSFHPASFMSSVVLPSFFSHHVLLFVVSVSHCVPSPEKLNW